MFAPFYHLPRVSGRSRTRQVGRGGLTSVRIAPSPATGDGMLAGLGGRGGPKRVVDIRSPSSLFLIGQWPLAMTPIAGLASRIGNRVVGRRMDCVVGRPPTGNRHRLGLWIVVGLHSVAAVPPQVNSAQAGWAQLFLANSSDMPFNMCLMVG